ncbi:hypothetical protein OB905_00745 [Halobacteria archaeon AArc-dxtr1]|nr:hypothetical protein [Halobacteria archaeon AArc-dxtr1]
MRASCGVALLIASAVIGLAIAPMASVAVVDDAAPSAVEPADEAAPTEGGTDMAQFVQSNAAETESTVDAAIFEGMFEDASEAEQEAIVTDRIETLEERLESMSADRNAIDERDGAVNETVYNARLTRHAVELTTIQDAIDEAETRAKDANVDTDALAELRENADALNGSEVAAIATELAGVDPSPGTAVAENSSAETESGPPDEAGPPADSGP